MKKIMISIKGQSKLILQIAFGLLSIALGIYFIRHERAELTKVGDALTSAQPTWVFLGVLLILVFVIVQGLMYQYSFAAVKENVRLSAGISLFLKRNLVSVFLPAGMLTNMFFFNQDIEKREGVSTTQIYFASSIFSAASIFTAILVGLPALMWLMLKGNLTGKYFIGILITAIALFLATFAVISLLQKGLVYHLLKKKMPEIVHLFERMSPESFDDKKIWSVVGLSLVVELIGIAHLYIAIKALGGTPTLEIAIFGYAIVLLLLMSSPFLRGIGAIEVALTYVLTLFGFTTVLALSVAFLFRFFEFWSILILGIVALLAQRDNILLRILPAFSLFILGVINIFSALTPALPERLSALTKVIPLSAVHASTWLVVISGVVMLALSVFLLRGLRNAWLGGVCLSALSLIAHLTKGIDWEEAILAFVVFSSLIYQRQQYFVKPDLRLARRSIGPALIAVVTVIIFGSIGFYLLSPHHFNVDFSLWQSVREAVSTFLLINIDLNPATDFGREYLLAMNILGSCTLAFFAYSFLRPLILKPATTIDEDVQKAKALVEKYGRGSLDYFKTYYDKQYWFGSEGDRFVAFKASQNYAIVLENPIAASDDLMAKTIADFDAYCRKNGLRSAYYRIPESSKMIYEKMGKKLLPIGEEAVADLNKWTIDGSEKKGIRNSVNKLSKQGYQFHAHLPPQSDAFLQQLKSVSDEWLTDMKRTELVFSQGLFAEKELKSQTILSLENPEGKVIGFVNLIPDYTSGEANFDLMRKTEDAPNGTMDFLFVQMFQYLKELGFFSCNMGMVPMSGIEDPKNLQERVIKLAYERIRQFSHYKSLRDFKDKFDPTWQMMYFAYSAPFDLMYIPGALERVVEP
jgi:phosphatidylglycerol lysyltransferase